LGDDDEKEIKRQGDEMAGGYLGAWAFDVHAVAAGVVELRETNKVADLNATDRTSSSVYALIYGRCQCKEIGEFLRRCRNVRTFSTHRPVTIAVGKCLATSRTATLICARSHGGTDTRRRQHERIGVHGNINESVPEHN
jgi:hypothetical protein